MTYFNENDPFAAAWLGKLFPEATVDVRSVRDVQPEDLVRFRRVHLFGGIGGWEYALQLAGWPAEREVWTGSCPCQPFSQAGKQQGQDDSRHLWPEMFRLIRQRHPATVFGEQVERAIKHGWLDGVFADLEAAGYACGATVLGAHSVGAPHIRQRIFWVADTGQHASWHHDTRVGSQADWRERQTQATDKPRRHRINSLLTCHFCGYQFDAACGRYGCANCLGVGLADTERQGRQGGNAPDVPRTGGGIERREPVEPRPVELRHWDAYDIIACRDGKSRRIEPGTFPLAHGIPARVGRLRGYGNSIVPQAAAAFIRAFLEVT